MTFQVKKLRENKIDFDIIPTYTKKSSAKVRRSIRGGGETHVPIRSKPGRDSI